MTTEITPTICRCLSLDPSLPYAGFDDSGCPLLLCAACLVDRVALLLYEQSASEVAKLVHVEPEHVEAVTFALHGRRLKERDQRLSNRVNSCKQYIFRKFAKPKPRYFNRDDGGPASHRRRVIVPCEVEPKSLSSFADVVAYNRTATA